MLSLRKRVNEGKAMCPDLLGKPVAHYNTLVDLGMLLLAHTALVVLVCLLLLYCCCWLFVAVASVERVVTMLWQDVILRHVLWSTVQSRQARSRSP